jgi:putative flippase GtrA
MIKLFKRKINEQDEFIKYSLISLFCTLIFFIIYVSLNYITNGRYLVANGFAYFVSFTIQFILNQKLFKAKPDKNHKQILQGSVFVCVRLIGFPCDQYLLYMFVDKLHLTYLIGKLFDSLIMFIYNYLTNKFIVFKIK